MDSDRFDDATHNELDIVVNDSLAPLGDSLGAVSPHVLLNAIIECSKEHFDPKYHGLLAARNLVDANEELRHMLAEAWECKSYRKIRTFKLFRPVPVLTSDHYPEYEATVVRHWKGKYIGHAADALWEHIQESFHKANDPKQHLYAKYSPIVQSSGMGKSRAVDEMSKSHIVIPVVLRERHSTGYPPSDTPAFDFLRSGSSQRSAFIQSCSFLHALFRQTAQVLKNIKEEPVAERFREYMTEGMWEESHGPSRTKFYEDVLTHAQEYRSSTYWPRVPEDYPSHDYNDRVDQFLLSNDFPLLMAFNELRIALGHEPITADEQPHQRSNPNQSSKDPLVVLAFDEAHVLTRLERRRGDHLWSRFGELCRAIRGLKRESLFTLFISTSPTLFSTPNPGRGDHMLPFCEFGFDQLATRVDFSQTVTLSQVSSRQHLISYGRPLWDMFYQPPYNDPRIIDFAAAKLLGGITYRGQILSPNEQFACLARRIPIEFLSAVDGSQASDEEKEQVGYHMRVILKVDDNLETMVTVSSSEPTLSEAAYVMMTHGTNFSSPRAFQAILNGFAVNKSELGELIVALLFIMARDEAVGSPVFYNRSFDNQGWCGLTELLASLFCAPSSASVDHVDVINSCGWRFTANNTEQVKSSLADAFEDSRVYFTHFIKVHEHSLIHVECLMRLMARGAAILRTQDPAVNGIIPFLLTGDEIRPDNIGVIMFRVQNDVRCTHIPEEDVFTAMNPRFLEVISPSADVPVIRIVFALTAKTPRLVLVRHGSASTTKESYTAYDFWVAALSSTLLAPVGNEQGTWDSILQVLLLSRSSWETIFSGLGQRRAKLRRSMIPGVAVERESWENWCTEPAL